MPETIVVALIGMAGTILGAFISGLMQKGRSEGGPQRLRGGVLMTGAVIGLVIGVITGLLWAGQRNGEVPDREGKSGPAADTGTADTATTGGAAAARASDAKAAADLLARANPIYGPARGSIPEVASGTNIFGSQITVRAFVAGAEFHNPVPPAPQPWAYGFLFRWRDWQHPHYRLFVNSHGDWRFQLLDFADNELKFLERGRGHVAVLNLHPDATNELRIVVDDKVAYFLVNDSFVESLPLTGQPSRGDVLLGFGFEGDGGAGREVRFEQFKVLSLDP